MCNLLVFLFLIVAGASAVQIVRETSVPGIIYHPISVIQEEVGKNLPIISKSVLVPSGIAYNNALGTQTSLHYTERDVASGYASHVLGSNVEFTVPELNIEHVASKEIVVQPDSLLSYAVNVEPIVSGYTAMAKSVPVASSYHEDAVSNFARILSSPQVDSSYNLNVLQSESSEVPQDATGEVKKAPLYTEAIFKPWPPLHK